MKIPRFLTSLYIIISLLTYFLGDRLALTLTHPLPGLLLFPFIGLGNLFSLALTAFLLYMTLSTLLMRLSPKKLTIFFCSATLFISLTTLALLLLTNSSFALAGPSPLLYCLLTYLLLSDPHLKLLLLGLLPLRPKQIVITILAINTVELLVEGAYMQVIVNVVGVLYGFIFYWFEGRRGRKHRIRK